MEISTIGLDLAKSVFQVHGVDGSGKVVVRKALRRSQLLPFFRKLSPCLVGMEACGTSHKLSAAGTSSRSRASGRTLPPSG
jgi:transposase